MGIDAEDDREAIDVTRATSGPEPLAPDIRLGRNIADRLASLAAVVVRISVLLPKDATGRHIAIQMVRAATGAGANYEEARAAESRADFVHKACVALKELREARYWVMLVQQTGWVEDDLAAVLKEAGELAAILGASVRTARARLDKGGLEWGRRRG
jgi:four helix bundle protein